MLDGEMYAQAAEPSVAIVRVRGEWLALCLGCDVSTVLGRSLLAGPLVRELKEDGFIVTLALPWHHLEMTGAGLEPTTVEWTSKERRPPVTSAQGQCSDATLSRENA
jgi:hypothetical protein